MSGDAKAIAKAPGIGTKTAQKVILELKDKISIDDVLIDHEIAVTAQSGSFKNDSPEKREAIEALISLGYGQTESISAVNSVENIENMDSGAILKAALKKMF